MVAMTDSQAPPEPAVALELDVPVVELIELQERPQRRANWLARLAVEAAPFAIIAGFFWLEVQVDIQMSGPARTLLLLLVVMVELGLISAWNLLRNRVGYH